jgi:hypothetical protein
MRPSIALTLSAFVMLAIACNSSSSSAPAQASANPSAAPPPAPAPSAAASTAASAAPPPPTPAPAKVAKIAPDKVNAAGKSVADRVSKAFIDALKSGKFSDSADLSDDLKKVTDTQWKGIFDGTKAKYGDSKSMTFADAWDDEKGGTMYRYKAVFAKAPAVELRVDLNGQNKATKFGTYDWLDATP